MAIENEVGLDDLCLLVSGRWDNTLSVVDVKAALEPRNDGTANAILNSVRITPDMAAGGGTQPVTASGQPVTVVLAPDSRTVFVVNHSGAARPDATAAFQHGHRGAIAELDLAALLDPVNAGTLNAVRGFIETGTAGPVGCALTPDRRHLLVTSAEAEGHEDGGRLITVIDIATRKVLRQVGLATRSGEADAKPSTHPAPHPSFGSFPCPNGIAVSPREGGLAFTANGGTGDVSVVDLRRALDGAPGAEIARIPVEVGAFGIAASPDGALIAVASREDAQTGRHGSTVSLIDIECARAGAPDAEVARVPVGGGEGGEPSRPFDVAFTPDGAHMLVTCNRSGMVSFVDVTLARARRPAEVHRLRLVAPSGEEPFPRGVAVAPDGRLAAIVGRRKGSPRSSIVWLIDLAARRVSATTTGVGNESYALAFASRPRR